MSAATRDPARRRAITVRRVALAVVLAAVPAGLGAQRPDGGPRLSLGDAVRRAVQRHPTVEAARADGDRARAVVAAAAAARWPTVALSASATQFQEPMLVTPLHGFAPGQTLPFDRTLVQGATTLGYTVFDGGTRGARIRRAREQAAVADAAVDESEQALVARVATTYVHVLARQQVVEAHDARIAALDAERSRAQQRCDVGRAPRVELLRAEAALASARAERVRAAEASGVAERELARLTGAPVADTRAPRLRRVALADSPLAARDVLVAAAIATSPVIERARRQRAAADAEVGVAAGARRPQVAVTAGWFQRGSASTRSWGEWSAGTAISLPLFTGGATGAELARAQAVRREAEHRVRLAETEIEAGVDQARSSVVEARARKASLSSAVERFAEVARIQRLALDAGSGTQTDFLAAEAELLTARAGLVEASTSEIVARTELARAAGQLTLDWLERTLETNP